MPVALGFVVVEQNREGRPVLSLMVVVWALTFLLLACRQERFSDMLSVVAALLIGKLAELSVRLCRRARGTAASSPVGALLAILLACAAIFSALPTASWLRSYWYSAPRLSVSDCYEWCLWLRDNTPESGSASDDDNPGYSVLASWPYGHAITYIGQRPNVANPFVGWDENREANLAPYRFFIEDDPAAAMSILDKFGVRYIVVTESLLSGHIADMLVALDLPHDAFFSTQKTAEGQLHAPKPRIWKSMVHRLYIENGKDLNMFDLVYSSQQNVSIGQASIPKFKIFEYAGQQISKEIE
jgi:dolichyl-diphosphooligosaccharide--protein glycosyltransferase